MKFLSTSDVTHKTFNFVIVLPWLDDSFSFY